ncbi:MAG: PAS domain S-box protein [Candidatus Lokiarchaeota archaeon]|nr:PAS domain S-box protein [Candidatus Lokiarchaeota archaeon]
MTQQDFFELFSVPKREKQKLEEIISNLLILDLPEMSELEYVNKRGSTTWVELFFSSIRIKDKKYIQVILVDITERKLADNIIKEENRRLRELNEMKKNLTAQASEKLKNPLSFMSKASNLLIDNYKDKLDDDALRLLELIKNGGETSMNLVGKIVDISRIETDTFYLNKQTESITIMLKESINAVFSTIEKNSIVLNLDLSEDLYSYVDRLRIEQAFKEILVNIIKYTSKDEKITISINKVDNYGEIIIKGIFKDLTDNILNFDLHYSKEIIELHEGQINIDKQIESNEVIVKVRLPIKNWREALLQLYVIYKSGIPLYYHSFDKSKNGHDTSLISGGIIGLMTILKAIIKGERQIRSIDHGDRTIIFESNKTTDIIFVLIVKENLIVFERKLGALIEEFDKEYKHLVDRIEDSSAEQEHWETLETLINKYYGN